MMSKTTKLKPIAAAIGTGFVVSLSWSPLANAAENPFNATELSGGYMVAAGHGEGNCGEKKAEGSCGEKKAEGSCGEKKAEGSCGEKKAEGSCGEKKGEGNCGEKPKKAEGNCGEGKCGNR
jgi:uncharacterized low-complexity protein